MQSINTVNGAHFLQSGLEPQPSYIHVPRPNAREQQKKSVCDARRLSVRRRNQRVNLSYFHRNDNVEDPGKNVQSQQLH